MEDLLKNTYLYNKIAKIKEIYLELEQKQKSFCSCFDIHCVAGCGACCEHFVPYITENEAIYLALGIIINNDEEKVRSVLKEYKTNSTYCPLYNFNDDNHCTVYKWRPLVCRLFNGACSKDKDGNPAFRQCKYNTDKKEISKELLLHHKQCLVIMSDFGAMLESDEDASTYPIYEILPKYLDYIEYLKELEKEA